MIISGIIQDPVARTDTIRIEDLQLLLTEGKKLDFAAEEEEQQLQCIIDIDIRICTEVKDLLSKATLSPLFHNLNGFSKPKGVYCCPYDVEEVEQLLCLQLQVALNQLSPEESLLATQPMQLLYESTYNTSSFSKQAEDNANIPTEESAAFSKNKINLEPLRNLIQTAQLYKCKLNELLYLQEIISSLDLLNGKVDSIVNSFLYNKDKSKVDPIRKRLDWCKIVKLFNLVIRYPCVLPSTSYFIDMMRSIMEWRVEVQKLGGIDSETKSSASSSKRNPRSSVKKESKTLPLKRIEVLLYEGDRFPFNFPEEMAILREQREQAKLLIKKLRESLELTRRKNKRNGDDESAAGKMVYSEFKNLLMEGESFYLGGDENGEEQQRGSGGSRAVQKDLDRAQSVMEIAEEWLNNVREMISSHFEFEINLLSSNDSLEKWKTEEGETAEDILVKKRTELVESLKGQLTEADTLPFTLEEADIVRYQLQAIEWAIRSRPWLLNIDTTLGSKALPRFVDAVQMKEEIVK